MLQDFVANSELTDAGFPKTHCKLFTTVLSSKQKYFHTVLTQADNWINEIIGTNVKYVRGKNNNIGL